MRRFGSLRRPVVLVAVGLGSLGVLGFPAITASAQNVITVASPSKLTSLKGDPVYLPIQATDSEAGETLTYSAAGLPPDLTINSSTGVISGWLMLPPLDSGDEFFPEVTVTDSTGASGSVQFSWIVIDNMPYSPIGAMKSAYSGMCLDNRHGGTANGNPIQLWYCNGSAAQRVSLGSFNSLRVMGKCVDDTNDSTTAGTYIQLYRCNGGDAQIWLLYPNGGVQHSTDVNCINAPADTAGIRLRLGNCDPYQVTPPRGMRWRAPATSVTSTVDGKCISAGHDPGGQPIGSKTLLWTCNGTLAQDWNLEPASGTPGQPLYNVQMFFGGGCLDVYHSGTTNGTKVDRHQCNGTAAQVWRITGGGELVNPNSGKCLDDPNASTANGVQLDIYTCIAGAHKERWTLPATRVRSVMPGSCLDNRNSSAADGNPIQAWRCNGSIGERWTLKPNGTLRAQGKCLDVLHSSTANGSLVDLRSCNGTAAQRWRLHGGELVNPASARCLDIPGASPSGGVQLVIWDCATAKGGRWHIQ